MTSVKVSTIRLMYPTGTWTGALKNEGANPRSD